MLRIANVSLPLDFSERDLLAIAAHKLRVPVSSIHSVSIARRSVDARDKRDVHFVASLDIDVLHEDALLKKSKGTLIRTPQAFQPELPICALPYRPLIVGAGPSGLFAALILAKAGARPILIERGADVDTRSADVQNMVDHGILVPDSNVQFGEGGAGTFSDGKLTTGTKSPWQTFVLETFVRHGAPETILIDQKPHIGTDILRNVVKGIREEICTLGGEVRFHTRLTSLIISDGRISGARVVNNGQTDEIHTEAVFLCIGHSSRDTLEQLLSQHVHIIQKPFAMGVRIEHLQKSINRSQYGLFADHPSLSAASYKLHCTTPDGRGVYTFCMCPGGVVMAASSEPGHLCVNGMSYHSRDGQNANSALLVGIPVSDFPSDHPLAGMYLQRSLEEKAYKAGGGGYHAPSQRVEDFLLSRETSHFGEVLPSYRPGVASCDLHAILPSFMSEDLAYGIRQLDHQLHGFAHPDAVLTAVEARSSSPVRLVRNEDGQSEGLPGLYPCGEGAGYAGGIMSASVDGIVQALHLLKKGAET
ncbi:MAG: FAD-dependent monooxygenase [Clostridia bacterium]|nr:FAD-dependent monooxygenase [Clostridia bacterium]